MLSYGNIRDRSLSEIMGDRQRDQFVERQAKLPHGECKGCRFWGMCHGGCPLDAYQQTGSFIHKSPDCEIIRTFVPKYLEPITGCRADFPPPATVEAR